MSDSELIRLNKFLAQSGIASRRGADEMVFAGRVAINGVTADSPGAKVDPGRDKVAVDGKPVALPGASGAVTLMLHKPIETVTTAKDPQGRRTVLDLLPKDIREMRPFPVGRLDFYSEGLLLLTTDGDLCHRLTHPKWHLPKVYEVTIRGGVPRQAIETMRTGMTLADGTRLASAKIVAQKPVAGAQVLEITLIQGVNRQIRRMCQELGLTILRLFRVRQGPLKLGGLKNGQWRELTPDELSALRGAVGLD
ncbi:pseudouridine synthase [Pseudodesulfovibrio sp.]|uniref:pseudouridine synthase n=1 Tax=Pseudodesulfovibrio sp. TaxID=2035812 RepID=UPI00262BEC22|nr:pseudouridine synthase [Pseudodesulfovibrio sp.]MDD3313287.1 pseudouridine synthase [Pseudodesulfovibrio sp.]